MSRRDTRRWSQGSISELAGLLAKLNGAGYGKYRELSGVWEGDGFTLEVVKVQADPYAPASRLEVRVPARVAALPAELRDGRVRRMALADFLLRGLVRAAKGSRVKVDVPGQQVLERSAVRVHGDGSVSAWAGIDLPGRGRRIDGPAARKALCEDLPRVVESSLRFGSVDPDAAWEFVETVEDAEALRGRLPSMGLVAFVADGANLARRSGVDDRPQAGSVLFESPPSLRTSVELPNAGRVTGMGIPTGTTLIVGGGFHGKSTLLRSLEYGVYNHLPGDGRELVVADPATVKIRSEDGRSVTRVDIGTFVGALPTGDDTRDFSSQNASGSTSQAAGMMEALEAGARVLLIDEDTAATNIMIRDERMRQLVAADKEPLTPFVDVVESLSADHGVSTIIVMGGSGDYVDVADHVIMMDAYRPRDATDRAAALRGPGPSRRRFAAPRQRVCDPASIESEARGRRRIKGRGRDGLVFGEQDVELRGVEQIVAAGQVIGIGLALAHCRQVGLFDGHRSIADVLDALDQDLERDGLEALGHGYLGDYALPRRYDVAAALSRLRSLRVTRLHDPR